MDKKVNGPTMFNPIDPAVGLNLTSTMDRDAGQYGFEKGLYVPAAATATGHVAEVPLVP